MESDFYNMLFLENVKKIKNSAPYIVLLIKGSLQVHVDIYYDYVYYLKSKTLKIGICHWNI